MAAISGRAAPGARAPGPLCHRSQLRGCTGIDAADGFITLRKQHRDRIHTHGHTRPEAGLKRFPGQPAQLDNIVR